MILFFSLILLVNILANTEYFYLVIGDSPEQFQYLFDIFGKWYLLIIDLITIGIVFIWYAVLNLLNMKSDISSQVSISNSTYISKKNN